MKVQILESMIGTEHAWLPGEVVEVSDVEASRMVAAGVAQPLPLAALREAPGPETAEQKLNAKRSKR